MVAGPAEVRAILTIAAALAGVAGAGAASAQQVDLAAEIATDERRRGISWTDGRGTPSAAVTVRSGAGLVASARVTGTRDSARHAGAEAVADLEGGYGVDIGLIRVEARAIGHLFAGADPIDGEGMDYGELGAGAGLLFGPVQLDLFGRYAPPQDAIGGDNLYVAARAGAGIPLTPFTLRAGVGRSSGSVDDPIRAARLRPVGRYHDWMFGVDHVLGPLTLAAEYTGTDIDDGPDPSPYAVRRHAGDRVTFRAAVRF
jgi:hypothetical protein